MPPPTMTTLVSLGGAAFTMEAEFTAAPDFHNAPFRGATGEASFLQIFQHRLGAGVHVQLFINVLDMIVKGPDDDTESVRDFLIQDSLAHVVEDFLLPHGGTP